VRLSQLLRTKAERRGREEKGKKPPTAVRITVRVRVRVGGKSIHPVLVVGGEKKGERGDR